MKIPLPCTPHTGLNRSWSDKGKSPFFASESLIDSEWDSFLERTHLGEHLQSCAWARYKQMDGWLCSRYLLKSNQQVVAGFQVLYRSTRFGRIGYVIRGPVAAVEEDLIVDALVRQLMMVTHQLKLKALIVQPPRKSRNIVGRLQCNLFLPNHLVSVINASLLVDVSGGMQAVERKMNKTWRKHIRQAIRRGVIIREGDKSNIGDFFKVMLKSCERQAVIPSPSSESGFLALWEALRGACRLTFAEIDGRIVAGLFCFYFKDTVKIWKKGAYSQDGKNHPMELLYHDAFSWAHHNGFRYCDFGSMHRNIAEALLSGLPLTESQKHSRDFFHVGLGGQPIVFSDSLIYIPNAIMRWGYRTIGTVRPQTLNYLKRFVNL